MSSILNYAQDWVHICECYHWLSHNADKLVEGRFSTVPGMYLKGNCQKPDRKLVLDVYISNLSDPGDEGKS